MTTASARLAGIDMARALAVIGMFAAHLVNPPADTAGAVLVHGHPSVLFGVLAGVSLSLMSNPAPRGLLMRGLVLFTLGVGLELLATPVAVILTVYGALYVLAIPALRWRTSTLAAWAGVLLLASPWLVSAAGIATLPPFGYPYPILLWLGLLLGGMAIGRCDLHDTTVQWRLLATGTGLAAVGFAAGSLAAQPDHPVWAFGPHSGGSMEGVYSGGVAAAILAGCLLLAPKLGWVALPLTAMGSMPLTAYVAHLLAIFAIYGPGSIDRSVPVWAMLTVAILAGCTAWSLVWGRGPLERLLSGASRVANASSAG